MKRLSVGIGVLAAGLALTAAPVLAGQRPSEGAPSHGSAVDRPSGGSSSGAGSAAPASAPAGTASSGGAGTTVSSSPSAAASTPSFSGAARHAASAAEPQHRGASSNAGSGSRGASHSGEHAVPRSGSASPSSGGGHATATTRPSSGSATNSTTPGNTRTAGNANAERAVPSWSRPRGDRPATGVAVPRTTAPGQGGGVIIIGGRYYDPFFPYGFGYPGYSLGLGFGFYDPWYDPFMYSGYGYGGGGGYYPYNYGAQDPRDTGEAEGAIRLKVKPRDAKVYIDGVFVGVVDSFDGTFQKLSVSGGHHKVEIRAEGYETAEFDVLVTPEQTVTYQGELKPIR